MHCMLLDTSPRIRRKYILSPSPLPSPSPSSSPSPTYIAVGVPLIWLIKLRALRERFEATAKVGNGTRRESSSDFASGREGAISFKAVVNLEDPVLSVSPLSALTIADNPLCVGRHDLRLELLHQLPNLTEVDGRPADAQERVAAHNMHGADNDALRATRRKYFNDSLGTAEAVQLPKLMQLYRNQYTQAFIKGDLKLGWRE